MASINGVSVKCLKKFTGMEGLAYQGNIYISGSKAGFWTQSGDGGCDTCEFDSNLLKNQVYAWKSYLRGLDVYTHVDYFDLDCFMAVLVGYCELEKKCKSFFKKGYSYIYYAIDVSSGVWSLVPLSSPTSMAKRNEVEESVLGSIGNYGFTENGVNNKRRLLYTQVISKDELFEIKIGSIKKVKEEENLEKKRRLEEEKKYQEYEKQREEEKKNRFSIQSLKDEPSAIIKDSVTGKSVKVSNYAVKEVVKALMEFLN